MDKTFQYCYRSPYYTLRVNFSISMWIKHLRLALCVIRLVGMALLFVGFSTTATAFQEAQISLPTTEQVHQGAAALYQKKIKELDQAQLLDTDDALVSRAQRILARLKAQAATDFAASTVWHWELHSSADPTETAYAMAGGKLLISVEQVRLWNLSETELAMLIAHEMAHALLAHNQAEYAFVLRQFPAWRSRSFADLEQAVDEDQDLIQALAPLGKDQELQADEAGWTLAKRAGYPVAGLLSFYKKLAKQAAYPNFESASHPAPAQRYARARVWATDRDDSAASHAR